MTRFEALGVLPDKTVPIIRRPKDEEDLWKIGWRLSLEAFVDKLPENASYKIIYNKKQPKLGLLIKIQYLRIGKGLVVIIVRPDQRKLKRNAKRFDWKLPAVEADLETHKQSPGTNSTNATV